MFRLSTSHHQGLSNSASQMLGLPIIDIRKFFFFYIRKIFLCTVYKIIYKYIYNHIIIYEYIYKHGELRLKIIINYSSRHSTAKQMNATILLLPGFNIKTKIQHC